jgi:hypothetical protein
MPSIPNRQSAALYDDARWPLIVWAAQLFVLVPIVAFGIWRLAYGPAPGALVLPMWVVAVLWSVVVVGFVAGRRGRAWIRAHRYQLLLSLFTSVVSLGPLAEAGVRLASSRDVDGNVFVRGHHLRPYRLPVKRVEDAARAYYSSNATFVVEDPYLGWVSRPRSKTALYTYNAQGIRVISADTNYPPDAAAGTLRLAVFGDSYTNGAEVRDHETWAAQSEALLRGRHESVELLNLGVNGYGMDQAYLRWEQVGRGYNPDVVVFGLQAENIHRNVNLIRPLYQRATENLPFAKPRFVLENGQLRLINSPVLPPSQLPAILRNIDAWPLARYEAYYRPDAYVARPWEHSLAIGFLTRVMAEQSDPEGDDEASADEQELGMAILEAFEKSVHAAGARFVVMYMPKRADLRRYRDSGQVPNMAFVERVRQRFEFIETVTALRDELRTQSFASLYGATHYSLAGNQVVARVLSDWLSQQRHRLTRPAGVEKSGTSRPLSGHWHISVGAAEPGISTISASFGPAAAPVRRTGE